MESEEEPDNLVIQMSCSSGLYHAYTNFHYFTTNAQNLELVPQYVILMLKTL